MKNKTLKLSDKMKTIDLTRDDEDEFADAFTDEMQTALTALHSTRVSYLQSLEHVTEQLHQNFKAIVLMLLKQELDDYQYYDDDAPDIRNQLRWFDAEGTQSFLEKLKEKLTITEMKLTPEDSMNIWNSYMSWCQENLTK